jgi:lysophospholipase L1-like esterase
LSLGTTATTSSASTAATRRRSRRAPIHAPDVLLVAALGDSITEGSPEYDARRGGDETSQWEYWATRARPRLRFRNRGVYGERTDEVAARFDCAVEGAAAVVLQGGINDIAQGRSVDVAAANMQALVSRAKANGIVVALADVVPWNNGWPDAESPIRALNELLSAVAAEEAVVLLRFHDTLEDADRPGRINAEWAHADGDHPSIAGYRRLGEYVASALTPWLDAKKGQTL